jgi:hypothetical protein
MLKSHLINNRKKFLRKYLVKIKNIATLKTLKNRWT